MLTSPVTTKATITPATTTGATSPAGTTAATTTTSPATADLDAIKTRQQAMWASGDFSIIGTTLQVVGESLAEALDLRSGTRVLDVAAGNGNCSLAAARRWCDVTSTDYVPALLADGQRRAEAERLAITFREADVESLPFDDGQFDVVMSSFGVMFAPNHARAASEMLRVCRPGGKIGLANWTPGGFIGQLLKTVGGYVPPSPLLTPPSRWGTPEHLDRLLGPKAAGMTITTRQFMFRYRSPQHWVDVFRTWYGPTLKAFAALPLEKQRELERDLLDLIATFNVSRDGTAVIPGEYLEVVVTTR